MCTHFWLETTHTQVCNRCGLEKPFLKLGEWDVHSAPLVRNYNRQRRFENKVDRLLGMHPGPQYSDPIWKMLEKTPNLHGPACIRSAIRQSTLTAKHYDCVRIFTDVFTDFKIKPMYGVHQLKKRLCDDFKTVHQLWAFSGQQGFFSYDFLLRLFIERLDSPLVVYLKPPTNRRRHAMYTKKLIKLSQRESKRYYRNSVATRSRSVSKPASSHHCPRRLVEDHGGLSAGDPLNRNVNALVNLALGQQGNSETARGGKNSSIGAFFPGRREGQTDLPDQTSEGAHTCE